MVVHTHFTLNTTTDIPTDPFWRAVALACVCAGAHGVAQASEESWETHGCLRLGVPGWELWFPLDMLISDTLRVMDSSEWCVFLWPRD